MFQQTISKMKLWYHAQNHLFHLEKVYHLDSIHLFHRFLRLNRFHRHLLRHRHRPFQKNLWKLDLIGCRKTHVLSGIDHVQKILDL